MPKDVNVRSLRYGMSAGHCEAVSILSKQTQFRSNGNKFSVTASFYCRGHLRVHSTTLYSHAGLKVSFSHDDQNHRVGLD